ncbi:unnamed protein product [Diamesa serratosioi]
MNDAKLYHKSNTVQKRDANQILDEFSHLFNWRYDGTDSLLDIGSGTGDVLVELIIPRMPKNFAKVIGVDLSENMTRYAKEKHQNNHVDFYKVDFASDLLTSEINSCDEKKGFLLQSMELGNYDFITSFYCLHWIQNQNQAISNIYNLLKANGTCLMAFLVKHPVFDTYLELSRSIKYKDYMNDVDDYVSPYHFVENPLYVINKYLNAVGFKKSHVEIKEKFFIYDNLEILKSSWKSINPFCERMPLDVQEDFLYDCVKVIEKLILTGIDDETTTKNFNIPYNLMVVNANK